jgi:hypothetical protein
MCFHLRFLVKPVAERARKQHQHMGRARHSSSAITVFSHRHGVDPFANAFTSANAASDHIDVGASIILEPAFGTGLRVEVRLRLDDDMALDKDPGGLHVTAWEHDNADDERAWYLQRRWPAQHFLRMLSQRPPIFVASGKTVIAGANKERSRQWLMRALGGTGSESVLTSR